MCSTCFSTPCICGCSSCPIKLDFSCVIYHKDNNEVTDLDGLDLNNGVTLEAVIEAIDEKVKQIDVPLWTLTYLRTNYVINSLQQFGQAVDSELSSLKDAIDAVTTPPSSQVGGYLGELSSTPSALNGQYWYDTNSNQLKIKVNNVVKTISIS